MQYTCMHDECCWFSTTRAAGVYGLKEWSLDSTPRASASPSESVSPSPSPIETKPVAMDAQPTELPSCIEDKLASTTIVKAKPVAMEATPAPVMVHAELLQRDSDMLRFYGVEIRDAVTRTVQAV
jgi:hypothetical protein